MISTPPLDSLDATIGPHSQILQILDNCVLSKPPENRVSHAEARLWIEPDNAVNSRIRMSRWLHGGDDQVIPMTAGPASFSVGDHFSGEIPPAV
ncbi:hypothetical protein A6X21_23200 [Planctopirus hydrillae]|uniref:Uncharacterized protein n=1 Tax=Planctopirus hydrillae TaxID=1841610 RepID=A0A1C3ECJ9_9PLAN|nr:hypothetical protein A6X21_23200 [Planctopirus hydrillae]